MSPFDFPLFLWFLLPLTLSSLIILIKYLVSPVYVFLSHFSSLWVATPLHLALLSFLDSEVSFQLYIFKTVMMVFRRWATEVYFYIDYFI